VGCIVFKLTAGSRATAAALIEGNNAIDSGIGETTGTRITSSTEAAMCEQDRYANDITCFVDIQLMLVCELYLVAVIGFELGKENLHRTGLILAKKACTLF
jgi:hypothetical protein